jgi:hypothetical protein
LCPLATRLQDLSRASSLASVVRFPVRLQPLWPRCQISPLSMTQPQGRILSSLMTICSDLTRMDSCPQLVTPVACLGHFGSQLY